MATTVISSFKGRSVIFNLLENSLDHSRLALIFYSLDEDTWLYGYYVTLTLSMSLEGWQGWREIVEGGERGGVDGLQEHYGVTKEEAVGERGFGQTTPDVIQYPIEELKLHCGRNVSSRNVTLRAGASVKLDGLSRNQVAGHQNWMFALSKYS